MTEPRALSALDKIAAIYEQQDVGASLEIKSPIDGEPVGLRVLVAGYEGTRMKDRSRALVNDRLKAGRPVKPSAESIETQNLDTIAATVISWEWAPGVTLNGEQPDATPEGIRKVFAVLPFVSAQIDAFAGGLANYAAAYEALEKAA